MPFYASHDGLRLHYDEAGDGTPLLVLPGGPGTDVRYVRDLGGLAATRRLIRADARAAGRSEVPADPATVSFVEQARDVGALRRHLGLETVDLLAHSAGTLTAQEYAAREPHRVRRMVLVTPVGRARREPDPAELAALRAARRHEPWYAAATTGTDGPLAQARMQPFSWHTWSRERRAEYVPGHASALPWLRDAFYAGSATAATEPARLARLAAVPIPVLVIAGASDGLIGTAPARLVAATYPCARLEIMTESGHRPWTEQPSLFHALVTDFLT
ncbi:alpha/beta hydrolase [Actinoplanes sp. NPDC051851]|uniref:alpha/beta fold hydrolase n=1 Tax=Actinoplanes sp. NPDC051851 TaxID=3154753 RepID=UPI00344A0AC1